ASQNVQVSGGQLGGAPAVPGQQLNATIIGKTRFETPEQFREILLKVDSDGSQVRLGDVARVELGAQNSAFRTLYNGQAAPGIAIQLATGANALETTKAVKETIDNLRPFFPEGVDVVYPFETAPVLSESTSGGVHGLMAAIVLAVLSPTLAVPGVLLGTFGGLAAFGFSINILTMVAMVLAIGLLVDDAIVVVENVERVMAEEGLSPVEATRKSMNQIQGALIGIGLVLSAVFVPMAFFGGSTGVIYRQFAITIASAMTLSVLVALIFTPALCATILKPIPKGQSHAKRGFFGWFNRTFERGVNRYEKGVVSVLRRKVPYLLLYAVIVGAMVMLFSKLPSSFLPDEDQGVMFVQVLGPAGSTMERTQKTVDAMREKLLTEEGDVVQSVFTVTGFTFAGRGQNAAIARVGLKPWEDRAEAGMSVFDLVERTEEHFSGFRDAAVKAFAPPAVMALGNATGFNFFLQDNAGLGHDTLMQAR